LLNATGETDLKMDDRAVRIPKSLQAIGLAVILFMAAVPGKAIAEVQTPSAHTVAPSSSRAIPPEEVAAKSAEVTNLLITFSENFAPSYEIEKIQLLLPEVSRQIDVDFTDALASFRAQAPLATLQAGQGLWQRRHLQLSNWLTLLTQRASVMQDALDRLAQLRKTWTQTRDAAQAQQAPQAILQQIETTQASLETAQLTLKTREEVMLGLQGSLAGELARCDQVLVQILMAQRSAVEGILARENLPIWSPELWDHARIGLSRRMRDIARSFRTNVREYIRHGSRGMPLHAALFLVLAMAACAARRKKDRWADGGTCLSSAVQVFDRPYSAALMVALLLVTGVDSPTPARVKDVLSALALVPMIRLVRPVIGPRLVPGVFAAVMLYAVDLVRQTLGGAPLVEQVLLILESLAAIAVLGWLLHAERLRHTAGQAADGLHARAGMLLANAFIFCVFVGFLAATFGFTRLARLLTPAAVFGGVLGLSLYANVRVLSGAVAIALRTWPLQQLQMVRNHCDRLERWIYRVLVWTAAVVWVSRSLEYVGMLDPVLSVGSAILGAKLQRGSISISIGDILAFGLTVLTAFLLSAFIRFALQEEVYPRRGVSRGLSYAYSRLIHYVILAIGFLVGLGVLGMDLTKVSVLAGAFGVGIGFGLQQVVNNFVCGLILLFERPVHVGDVVEVGDLQGEVRRIGIRASTVHTYRGADIIVPNAQFITANVTNWTLSDQLRRIDLPVGVNYGAAPQQVIEVLESVARANPGVLQYPAPRALFIGYGDSSINFELRVWTDQFDKWRVIRSELASAVYDAVYRAGMSFPFPQREVRVLGDSAGRKTGSLQPGDRTGPGQGDE
jgi:potassium efflux system protein